MTDDRGQMTEDRWRKTDDRKQRTELRWPRKERQRSEDRGWNAGFMECERWKADI